MGSINNPVTLALTELPVQVAIKMPISIELIGIYFLSHLLLRGLA